jgi:hypothetical protein
MATASEVISAVNALRSAHGLPSYTVSSILMGTAQAQADYMASTGSVSHTGPGGVSVTNRLLAAGYPLAGDLSLGGFRSENIVGSPGMTAEGAVSSWTGDDLHLHTMLSADLQEIGAGVAEKDGVTYFVIDCARPTGSGVPVAYTPGAEAALSGGDDIIMPVSMSTPDPEGNLYHEVQAGQSLWQIAIAYGVKIADIQKLNSLGASTVINRGQKLLIKHVDAPTAGPPTSTVTAELATVTAVPTLPVPTSTLAIAPTVVAAARPSGSTNAGVSVAAIAIVALLSAALVAWAGRARPI